MTTTPARRSLGEGGSPPVVMFMGPPASGKGTQAQALLERGGFERIETGSILRQMRNDPSPIAKEVIEYVDAGKLAPPPLVAELVIREARKLLRSGKGVIFDGSPRTLFEAEVLLRALQDDGIQKIIVVALEVPKPASLERVLLRWVCTSCRRASALPPGGSPVCSACGGTLERRKDDTAEVLEKRWEEFTFRTLPVIEFFARHNMVIRVDGHRPVPEVTADVQRALDAFFRQ